MALMVPSLVVVWSVLSLRLGALKKHSRATHVCESAASCVRARQSELQQSDLQESDSLFIWRGSDA